MTDPIAEAAAHLSDAAPSSTEPVQPVEAGNVAGGVSQDAQSPVATSAVDAAATASAEVAQAGESAQSSPASTTSATPAPSSAEVPNDAATPPAGAATPATTGNVLLNAAPTVDASVIAAPAVEPVAEVVELPRESHLMLLEAKFANALAKLRNAERVSVDELESIYVHIKAVI